MIYVRQSLDNSKPVARLDTECVRGISCLPYVGHLCERVPAGCVCALVLIVALRSTNMATLTKSGHNQVSQSAPLRQTRNFERICVRRTPTRNGSNVVVHKNQEKNVLLPNSAIPSEIAEKKSVGTVSAKIL